MRIHAHPCGHGSVYVRCNLTHWKQRQHSHSYYTWTALVRNSWYTQIKHVSICAVFHKLPTSVTCRDAPHQPARHQQSLACCCGSADLLANHAAYSSRMLLIYILHNNLHHFWIIVVCQLLNCIFLKMDYGCKLLIEAFHSHIGILQKYVYCYVQKKCALLVIEPLLSSSLQILLQFKPRSISAEHTLFLCC